MTIRKIAILFFVFLISMTTYAKEPMNISVLYIGNSFTSTNDLPAMVAEIAKSLGDHVEYQTIAPGGYLLRQHAANAETVAAIKSGKWNYVVLQEQSQVPATPKEQFAEVSIPAAKFLNQVIRDAKAKTVIFETWGYKNGDPMNCEKLNYYCTYSGMQEAIAGNTYQLTYSLGAMLAPVGDAFSLVTQLYPDLELYNGDGKHPSVAGTYLAACVMYTTLFNKSVMGATPLTLDSKVANILQTTAVHMMTTT